MKKPKAKAAPKRVWVVLETDGSVGQAYQELESAKYLRRDGHHVVEYVRVLQPRTKVAK